MLTLCMIVKNEERDLQKCLASVSHLVSELVIVDTGSTDATPQIAARCGAKVIPFDFTKIDFAAARNHAISHATNPWIIVLDADETLEQSDIPKVRNLLSQNENAGYYLERHNHASDSPTAITDHVVRLFPNRPQFRYSGRVHEIISGGRLVPTDIRIHHTFVSNREIRRRKNYWYIQILKEELAANPQDDTRLDFLAAEYHQLEMFNEATAVAEQIVQLRPKDARAHLFLGTYHLLYQQDPVRARTNFNHALQLRPGYPEAISFLQLIDEQERLKQG